MDDSGLTSKLPPVIIAFIAGVGFSYTLLFPAYLGKERLEFEQARRDTVAWTKQRDELLIEKAALEKVLASTSKKLRQAEMASAFQYGSPYPTSLSDVRLGDPASAIEKAYPGVKITKDEDGDFRVAVEHSAVSVVFYRIDARAPQQPVTRIWFFMKEGNDAAINLFTTMFGAPQREERRSKIWNLPNGVQVQTSGSHYYTLTPYGTSSTTRTK